MSWQSDFRASAYRYMTRDGSGKVRGNRKAHRTSKRERRETERNRRREPERQWTAAEQAVFGLFLLSQFEGLLPPSEQRPRGAGRPGEREDREAPVPEQASTTGPFEDLGTSSATGTWFPAADEIGAWLPSLPSLSWPPGADAVSIPGMANRVVHWGTGYSGQIKAGYDTHQGSHPLDAYIRNVPVGAGPLLSVKDAAEKRDSSQVVLQTAILFMQALSLAQPWLGPASLALDLLGGHLINVYREAKTYEEFMAKCDEAAALVIEGEAQLGRRRILLGSEHVNATVWGNKRTEGERELLEGLRRRRQRMWEACVKASNVPEPKRRGQPRTVDDDMPKSKQAIEKQQSWPLEAVPWRRTAGPPVLLEEPFVHGPASLPEGSFAAPTTNVSASTWPVEMFFAAVPRSSGILTAYNYGAFTAHEATATSGLSLGPERRLDQLASTTRLASGRYGESRRSDAYPLAVFPHNDALVVLDTKWKFEYGGEGQPEGTVLTLIENPLSPSPKAVPLKLPVNFTADDMTIMYSFQGSGYVFEAEYDNGTRMRFNATTGQVLKKYHPARKTGHRRREKITPLRKEIGRAVREENWRRKRAGANPYSAVAISPASTPGIVIVTLEIVTPEGADWTYAEFDRKKRTFLPLPPAPRSSASMPPLPPMREPYSHYDPAWHPEPQNYTVEGYYEAHPTDPARLLLRLNDNRVYSVPLSEEIRTGLSLSNRTELSKLGEKQRLLNAGHWQGPTGQDAPVASYTRGGKSYAFDYKRRFFPTEKSGDHFLAEYGDIDSTDPKARTITPFPRGLAFDNLTSTYAAPGDDHVIYAEYRDGTFVRFDIERDKELYRGTVHKNSPSPFHRSEVPVEIRQEFLSELKLRLRSDKSIPVVSADYTDTPGTYNVTTQNGDSVTVDKAPFIERVTAGPDGTLLVQIADLGRTTAAPELMVFDTRTKKFRHW
ncbi:hypothetical protein ACFVVA_17440 [Kitasatospora sp. NPDC058048]|uniref:hypothetical protein n=1 Tax=Kitasatospora sp. NPDC058048 TaxID=3346313 RepID=UPI0036D7CF90